MTCIVLWEKAWGSSAAFSAATAGSTGNRKGADKKLLGRSETQQKQGVGIILYIKKAGLFDI